MAVEENQGKNLTGAKNGFGYISIFIRTENDFIVDFIRDVCDVSDVSSLDCFIHLMLSFNAGPTVWQGIQGASAKTWCSEF